MVYCRFIVSQDIRIINQNLIKYCLKSNCPTLCHVLVLMVIFRTSDSDSAPPTAAVIFLLWFPSPRLKLLHTCYFFLMILLLVPKWSDVCSADTAQHNERESQY